MIANSAATVTETPLRPVQVATGSGTTPNDSAAAVQGLVDRLVEMGELRDPAKG